MEPKQEALRPPKDGGRKYGVWVCSCGRYLRSKIAWLTHTRFHSKSKPTSYHPRWGGKIKGRKDNA